MPTSAPARSPLDLHPEWLAALGGVALALAGCAGDPDDGSTGSTAGETTAGEACVADATDMLGSKPFFAGWNGELVFRGFPDYSSLAGAFQDGPDVGFHGESARSGQCRLMTYTPAPCEPACSGDQLCQHGGSCVDPPRRRSGGTLTLTGPLTPAMVVEPDGIDGYFAESTNALDAAALLRLEGTAGADVPAFVATTCPVDAPAADGDWAALLAGRKPGADVTLRWTNPDAEARVRLRMTTGFATHGGIAHAEIECEGPDTGALTLPGSYLDTLYAEGWACGECGNNDLIRYRSALIGATGTAFTTEAVTTFFFIP